MNLPQLVGGGGGCTKIPIFPTKILLKLAAKKTIKLGSYACMGADSIDNVSKWFRVQLLWGILGSSLESHSRRKGSFSNHTFSWEPSQAPAAELRLCSHGVSLSRGDAFKSGRCRGNTEEESTLGCVLAIRLFRWWVYVVVVVGTMYPKMTSQM